MFINRMSTLKGEGEGEGGAEGIRNDVLPPLLGAARARLGASSSRMRQWVESDPCGQLELCLGAFPLAPVSTLVPLSMAPSLQTELCLDSIPVFL